ncbi:MAG TPA: membrane dipeptidase [Xanthomonadales bacterium]|nr:membrane dipeptidase [Xanthomonadales bacterium]
MSLTRRELIGLLTSTTALALAPHCLLASGTAETFYRDAIVIDGLGGPGGRAVDGEMPLNALELADVRASGLTAIHLTIGRVGTMPSLEMFEHVVTDLANWEAEIDAHPETLARIRTVSDIQAARDANLTGLIYGLQDGVAFEDDLDRLRTFQQLGIRIIQPTYNRRNLLGDGCMEPADAGLSRMGKEAIETMNNLGILVDLSHCGRQTVEDALTVSTRPMSFTHTGSFSLAEHPRHRTDEEIRAIADGGGVIGVYIMPYLARGQQPTADDVLQHIEHMINIAGEDHVSIGTDGYVSPTSLTEEYIESFRESIQSRVSRGIAAPFETETGYLFASDLNAPNRFETLADLMLERGHTEARVKKVLGGNLVRLFSETWKA